MPAVPTGYDPANLIPMVGFAISLGSGARSTVQQRPIVILGNKIASDLTRSVGGNNYTTTAGTLALATPTFVASDADADVAAGAGSEAANMYRAVTAQAPGKGAYLCLVAENGAAVKATAVVLFANAATSSGTVTVTVAGRSAQATIASGDAATTTATAVANLINLQTLWPVTATVSSATVTVTAKNGGTRGNNIPIGIVITASATTAALNGGTAGQSPTALMGVSTGTPGAGADDVTTALAALAPGRYFIVCAQDDTTNINLVKAHLGTYANISNRRRQQAVAAMTNATVGAAVTAAQLVNGQRVQIGYHRIKSAGSVVDPNIRSTGEIAASIAAMRLYGDGALGNPGNVRGELAYAACNLNNGQLAAIPAQSESLGARLLDSEIQQLLVGGLTPLRASSLNPGLTQIVRSVTSYSLDASSNTTYAVKLTSQPTIIDVVADRLESRITSEFPNKNIGQEPITPGTPPTHPDVIFPSMLLGSIRSELVKMQGEGLLIKTDVNNAAISLAQSDSDPSLVLVDVPASCIKPLSALAGSLNEVV